MRNQQHICHVSSNHYRFDIDNVLRLLSLCFRNLILRSMKLWCKTPISEITVSEFFRFPGNGGMFRNLRLLQRSSVPKTFDSALHHGRRLDIWPQQQPAAFSAAVSRWHSRYWPHVGMCICPSVSLPRSAIPTRNRPSALFGGGLISALVIRWLPRRRRVFICIHSHSHRQMQREGRLDVSAQP